MYTISGAPQTTLSAAARSTAAPLQAAAVSAHDGRLGAAVWLELNMLQASRRVYKGSFALGKRPRQRANSRIVFKRFLHLSLKDDTI
jgi:hypothetical protein